MKRALLYLALSLICLASPAFAREEAIYVSDAGDFANGPWQILKFDANGENPEVFTVEQLGWPQDIVFLEEDNIALISNFTTGRINRHDATTGEYLNSFASGIAGPNRMKFGADGLLYVLQWSGNGKVRRYQRDGTFVDEFTNVGVTQAIGLDWDQDGNLYVSSYSSDDVRKFNQNGVDQGLFISSGLIGPTNIWFDDSGDLLVSDFDGTSVKRFGPNGASKGDFLTGLSQSEGVAIRDNGDILIGNGLSRSVKRFAANGNYIDDFIPRSSGGLIKPNAVVIRPASDEFSINAGLNDAWFNLETPGQGFFFNVFPQLELFFLAWFTFDTERPGPGIEAILGEAGHRWVTAIGSWSGKTVTLNIELTAGGVFDSSTPAPDQTADYGTITIVFSDCNNATLTYNIPSLGLSGSMQITRVATDNVALCEALSGQ